MTEKFQLRTASGDLLAVPEDTTIVITKEDDTFVAHLSLYLSNIALDALTYRERSGRPESGTRSGSSSRDKSSERDEFQDRMNRIEDILRRQSKELRKITEQAEGNKKQLADSKKQIERLRWHLEAVSAKLRDLESRTQQAGHNGGSASGKKLASSAGSSVTDPATSNAEDGTAELISALLGELGQERKRSASDLVGLGSSDSHERRVVVKETQGLPDEIKDVVALIRRELAQSPEVLAGFEKGLANGIKMLGRQGRDGH